ncbi:MAG TPA: response regulator [Candidatus Limnocylindrales bacterium]|nr:response regulator [Candidatus Limnocylindrales bacterium]
MVEAGEPVRACTAGSAGTAADLAGTGGTESAMGGELPRGDPVSEPPNDSPPGAVLVVDDDASVRGDVARILGQAGIAVVAVGDGRRALRLVAGADVRPSVLLTDIEMPAMGGVELAARLLAIRPDVRVVMMTSDPAHAAAARDRTSIVATVIGKPIDAAELLAAVGPATRAVLS